jgi:predicted DNA-binding transcriptional regulator AlpA
MQTFLSPEELSERYDIPVGSIYGWRLKGYGPAGMKIGRHVRYPLEAVEQWEAEQTDSPSAA